MVWCSIWACRNISDYDTFSDLFPDSFEDSELGEIPNGWEVEKLGDVVSIQYGKNFPTKNLLESGFPVFGGNGIIGYHSSFLYQDEVAKILFKLINKKGIINVGGKSQYIFDFVKKYNKKIKKNYAKKILGRKFPCNPSMNIEKLKKILKSR